MFPRSFNAPHPRVGAQGCHNYSAFPQAPRNTFHTCERKQVLREEVWPREAWALSACIGVLIPGQPFHWDPSYLACEQGSEQIGRTWEEKLVIKWEPGDLSLSSSLPSPDWVSLTHILGDQRSKAGDFCSGSRVFFTTISPTIFSGLSRDSEKGHTGIQGTLATFI